MQTRTVEVALLCLALVAAACDGGGDPDAGTADAALAADSGRDDAGGRDAGGQDGGAEDGGSSDGGSSDAGPPPPPGTPVSAYGCACDGATDDSGCLQRALDDSASWTNRTLEWPRGATCVAANLTWGAPEGSEEAPYVLRGHGSVLRAPDGHSVRSSSPWDPILRVDGGRWLVFDDLDLDGNRDTRVPLENPSHNLLIMSSRDVLIRGLDSLNAVTDGLYIAASDGGDLASRPQRIVVQDPVVRRAYRNNISIINCVDCAVLGDGNGSASSCQLTDARGTPPQAGIDLEPNVPNASPAIVDATIDGCFIARNHGTGILLHSAGLPTGVQVRNNTVEGERRTFRATCGAAMHLGSDDVTIEDNVFRNYDIDPECRAMFDWGATSSSTRTVFRRNRIENVRFEVGTTHIFRIHPVNRGGHTIVDNTLVDIGLDEGGDWCLDSSSTGPSEIRGNTVDGVTQAPNPGCP